MAPAPDALHVNLTVPTTRVRLGPLSSARAGRGLQAFLGVPLADVLSPLMRAPRHQRQGEGGAVLDGRRRRRGVGGASAASARAGMARSRRSPPPEPAGKAGVRGYPLAIPDGEGLSIPVKLVGDLGFRNYRGLLVLIVPAALAEVVRQELAEEIASKDAAGPRFVEGLGGGGFVAEFAVRLRPGMRASVPLGALGECGLESR